MPGKCTGLACAMLLWVMQAAGAQVPPDPLGLHLPAGMTAAAVAALLLPGDAGPLNAVGVRPLPGEAGLYVAVACTGGDVPEKATDTRCAAYSSDAAVQSLKAYVGLLRMEPGTPPTLAARPAAVDGMTDWGHSDLPDAPDAMQGTPLISPVRYSAFDLAPYMIAPGVRAFGLRGTWEDGYSGGLAEYSALYLFAVIDGAVHQVLTAPMSEYRSIAGDWHKDGTRDHQITDVTDVLIVTRHSTDGHFDLRRSRRGGKDSHTYHWSSGSYR